MGESPPEQAIRRENLEPSEAGLAKLKPIDREAISGRIEMGNTYQELADALGKPTAEVALKATRRALFGLAEEMRRGRD